MPSGSVIAAVIAKYETLTAANFPSASRPPIWLDEAPQQGGTGTQSRPPYTIIRDGGGRDDWDTEQNATTPGSFSLDVYYVSLADCDTAMNAILWNGSIPNLRAGIAFCTLSLTAPLYGIPEGVRTTSDQHGYAGVDYQGQRVYKFTQDFDAIYGLRGTG